MNISRQRNKLNCKKPNTISLLFVYALPNTIIVLFSPCTLSIGKFYNVDIESLYYLSIIPLLGFALGPLISPLISMKFGRKGALYAGSTIAVISILGSLFFTYIIPIYIMLLIFRFFSVLGASMAIVSVPAMINEYYYEFSARKMMFLISAIFCMWPGIIMGISGYISVHIGWQFTELFLLFYAVATYIMMIKLPETQAEKIKEKNLIKPYFYHIGMSLRNSQFILFTLIGSIMGIVIYYFISETPFIALHYMKMSSASYGYFSLIPYLAATASLLLGNFFANKLFFKRVVKIGIFGSMPSSILMLFLFMNGYVNVFSVFVLTAVIVAALSPSFGYSFAKAVSSLEEKSIATSLFLFIYMLISSVVPFIAKYFISLLGVEVYPITLIVISGFLTLLFTIYLKNNRHSKIEH
jgi:MFS family permease